MTDYVDEIREKAKKVGEKIDDAMEHASQIEHSVTEGASKIKEDVKGIASSVMGEKKKKEDAEETEQSEGSDQAQEE